MAVSSLTGAPFGYAVAPLLPLRTVASDTKELRAGLAKGKGVEALRTPTKPSEPKLCENVSCEENTRCKSVSGAGAEPASKGIEVSSIS